MDKQQEQDQVEQTAQTTEEVQTTIVEEKPREKTFTKDELTKLHSRIDKLQDTVRSLALYMQKKAKGEM